MKKYCINCGKAIDNKHNSHDLKEEHSFDYCSSCNTSNSYEDLDKIEDHEFNQKVHNNIIKANDMKNNSLCFIVGGFILLIIGIFFFVLSFKRNVIGIRVFSPMCFEFFIAIIALVLSAIALIYGFIRFLSAYNKKKYFITLLRKIK